MEPVSEVRVYREVVSAYTYSSAPVTSRLLMPPREVKWIEWRVPAGPNGLMGFRLTQGGATIIPYDSQSWIITDDESVHWDLTGLNNSGYWEITAYNSDSFDHSIFLRFGVVIPFAPTPPPAVIPLTAITPS